MAKPRLKLRPHDNSLEIEKRFATGNDPAALLQAIFGACVTEHPLPEWVRKGFILAYIKGSSGGLKSWDDAFGRPPTKQESLRFNRECAKRDKVWEMVAEAKAKGRGVGTPLFEEIGKQVGLNKTDVGRLYSEQCRIRGRPEKARTRKSARTSGVM